ncbi:MAG: SIS domain-containing protein [Verrucomicrobia bacterium]|nr:SIS domain-containing protein [Verrucomicrobiota bacterium]MBU4291710.1 SIS domain-containing protein [Verrucomicrobiota bacterium]MBU4429863.1 SIS domain-containing protein [Verrucomicrobiota bacterium]MCG2681303.1 SIS domain-containing protein [Kiritimatiellia bacterium]
MSQQESAFLNEVAEQPKVLRELIAFYRGEGQRLLEKWAKLVKEASRVIFSGMGTSEFAPDAITVALAQQGIDATTRDAGEWLHYPSPTVGIPVLISQSGESIETRLLAEQLKGKGGLVAITNNEASSLARAASLVLPMLAGHETAISTKTYVNTLAVLYLMAQAMEGSAAMENGLARLEKSAEAMRSVNRAGIDQAARLLADASAIHFVSRGPAVVAARQAALTFMEGTRISAAAYTGGAFRHGPFELVDENLRCVFFVPGGTTCELIKKMALDVVEKKGRVIVITDQKVILPQSQGAVLKVPDFGEDLFCLSAATTQELLLDAVAGNRGLKAGQFRYGEKITRRE